MTRFNLASRLRPPQMTGTLSTTGSLQIQKNFTLAPSTLAILGSLSSSGNIQITGGSVGDGSITTVLTWAAVPSATSYRIYRGTTSGVHPNSWNVGNVTEYDVNLLTPLMVFGTTYYFAITSTVGGVESAKSTQIQVRNWVLQ